MLRQRAYIMTLFFSLNLHNLIYAKISLNFIFFYIF